MEQEEKKQAQTKPTKSIRTQLNLTSVQGLISVVDLTKQVIEAKPCK